MYQFGLIGNPVKHSLSPEIHLNFLKQMGERGTYDLIEVKEDELDSFFERARQAPFSGLNVTIPFKTSVIPFLDRLDQSAKMTEAVNTIEFKDDELIGYNTDGLGFIQSLQDAYQNVLNSKVAPKVLLLGGGGAAKGIAHALSQYTNNIDIANRTYKHAENITRQLDGARPITLKSAEKQLSMYDIIIQTTSVGMSPKDDEQIISLSGIKEGTIVSDIVYRPLLTRFLNDAKSNGARILPGSGMLIHQAAEAFHLWTGFRPDTSELLRQFK